MDTEQEMLTVEYKEATEACRQNENLVRNGLSIFVAIQAALLGFIGTKSTPSTASLEVVLLEIFAIVVSSVVFVTTLRLQMSYMAYMDRAKCIERRLNMNLYTYAWEYMESSKAPGQCIGTKRLLAFIPLTTFVLFLVLIIRDGKAYLTQTLCW